MMTKASGRSALILVTGLFVCFAGPSQATASADGAAVTSKPESSKAAHGSRYWKRVAHRRSTRLAQKSVPAAKADAADDDTAANPSALPPSIANANAQLASADTLAGNAKAMTTRATTILQATPDNSANAQAPADGQVVSADQLNDVDRALRENTQGAPTQGSSTQGSPTMAMASADVPAAAAPVMAASSQENSTWDQTSLIGKIFIAFGTLLTMASAARMFMA
jgi:hypothetical protein